MTIVYCGRSSAIALQRRACSDPLVVILLQVDEIAAELMDSDLATRVDKSSAALGRRYARSDEIGVPFAVTVDFDTLKDGTVTIRERDSMVQIRLPKAEVTPAIFAIVHKKMSWDDLTKKYPIVQVDEGEGKFMHHRKECH